MEVESGARMTFEAAERKDSGEVRFVGRLVVRKPRISIDAEDRLLRISNVTGPEPCECGVQMADKLQHRHLDQLFVFLFPWLKPVATVVTLEPAQEGESIRRKSW